MSVVSLRIKCDLTLQLRTNHNETWHTSVSYTKKKVVSAESFSKIPKTQMGLKIKNLSYKLETLSSNILPLYVITAVTKTETNFVYKYKSCLFTNHLLTNKVVTAKKQQLPVD